MLQKPKASSFLCLCTCTYLELMTAIGVTLYLVYLDKLVIALIASIVFAKVIVFHFIIDHKDKKKIQISKIKDDLKIKE